MSAMRMPGRPRNDRYCQLHDWTYRGHDCPLCVFFEDKDVVPITDALIEELAIVGHDVAELQEMRREGWHYKRGNDSFVMYGGTKR